MAILKYPEPCAKCMKENPEKFKVCVKPCVSWDKWSQTSKQTMIEVEV